MLTLLSVNHFDTIFDLCEAQLSCWKILLGFIIFINLSSRMLIYFTLFKFPSTKCNSDFPLKDTAPHTITDPPPECLFIILGLLYLLDHP